MIWPPSWPYRIYVLVWYAGWLYTHITGYRDIRRALRQEQMRRA